MSTTRAQMEAIASNYAWTWDRSLADALRVTLGERHGRHPLAVLAELSDAELDRAAAGSEKLVAAAANRVAELEAPRGTPDVAYLSPEFGISETLPQYSGGLGILAGDHLKAASDRDVGLVAVGLFYANGYFRQEIGPTGQKVGYETYRPAELGLVDTGVVVMVETPKGPLRAAVWEAKVGRTRLFVLDTRVRGNQPWARAVTNRLYGGGQAKRIDQEWLLGIGGMRALAALGIHPPVVHLNEGHAGFGLLELAAAELGTAADFEDAMAAAGRRVLFTTHTPVPAGIDRFARADLEPYLQLWCDGVGVDLDDVWDRGILPSDEDPDIFNMAALSLRTAAKINGVSTLHGEVSRDLFSSLPEGANIGSITNGIHARTWVHPEVCDLFDDVVGPNWESADEAAWKSAGSVSDEKVMSLRSSLRSDGLETLAEYGVTGFDPNALTVGFARRFATYKRAALILREAERLAELLADDGQPIQFLFAGKAHPADKPGQAVLAKIVEFANTDASRGRFRLIPNYDVRIAQAMYAASDVWLNNPVRPREASGTSGEKSALNGGLNCSILDGWWAEWYHPDNGWAIPTSEATKDEVRDSEEARSVLELLSDEVVPSFYGAAGDLSWADRVRTGWTYLGPRVTANRMVRDYDERYYQPLRAALGAS